MWLRVSPTRGVRRFGIKGKLSSRYVGPFEILERVGEVAYRLALPPRLEGIHPVFHVSQLREYIHDPRHVISHEDLVVEPDHTFAEHPIAVLERSTRRLRSKEIPMLRIQWSRRGADEATWETEDSIRRNYPEFYADIVTSMGSSG